MLLGVICIRALSANTLLAEELIWSKLPSLPDKEGFASMFAGVSGGALLVAGGANFPDKKPWEGGKKVWHDTVFVLEKPDGEWEIAGKLPHPLGYGVSVTWRDSVICVGGSDAELHHSKVFRIEWRKGKLAFRELPPLPRPLANMSGTLLKDTLYLAGGVEKPDSTRALKLFLALDLSAKQPVWQEHEPWPGPSRMLAVAAVKDDSFFLVSGADLSAGPDGKPARTYLKDGYRYTPGKGWRRIADLPRAAVAAPSPAPRLGAKHFLVVSGDDASQPSVAPTEHKGFPKGILAYDLAMNTWSESGDTPAPLVTLPTAQWNGIWVFVSSEQRPGVRSPEVWSMRQQMVSSPVN